jgi:predicted nucleic acid-binding protein
MRIDRVVVNSSPLITLFNSGQAELLPQLFSEVMVPDAVWLEVAEGGHQDIAAQAIRYAEWIIRLPPTLPDPMVMTWDAGPGETAVISLARADSELRAIVDDDYARRCARVVGVRTLGTCGVIVLAKRRGIIPCVKPALDALRTAGLWLSDNLVHTILNEAGEL